MFVIVAPGQGSQTPGMLAPWLRDPARADLVRSWSEAADCDLVYLGTKAPAAEIARTEHTQPLLVAQGLLAYAELAGPVPEGAATVAGHSVGELTAAGCAGVLDPADAVRLAAERGRAMAAACAEAPTSMAAVVGGEESLVLGWLAGLGLSPATFNGAGQIVAAGPAEDLGRLAAAPPTGATVRPLTVAGAFHTVHMESARRAFAAAAAATTFHRPTQSLISNADGEVLDDPGRIRERLIEQLVRPVRWDLCMATISRLAPDLVLSLPPAKTLSGIFRRQYPDLDVLSLTTPRDLAPAGLRLAAAAERGAPAHAGV
ncbi:MAG TPA: ACP S-malonyltransferase [Actinocrinis sp.]|nr:ACP S-malonyltransferase [Actinocrinis sp.]